MNYRQAHRPDPSYISYEEQTESERAEMTWRVALWDDSERAWEERLLAGMGVTAIVLAGFWWAV